MEPPASRPQGAFPSWGWLALAWTLLWWLLAWTRFRWFAGLQLYTFFPLWLGFIAFVNALVARRRGGCLMLEAPGRWVALFAVSAGFWWVFEWLNRFVRNWHYLAVEDFSAPAYALHATVCFSTVLPAVAAVRDLLRTYPAFERPFLRGASVPALESGAGRAALFITGAGALLLTGLYPLQLYPALWVAPFAIGLALQGAQPAFARGMVRGDWREAGAWMAGALVCGFFWELWNFHSLAKWIYTVPLAERWHLFEMPAAGYAGYLPFGLECALAAGWVLPERAISSQAPSALLS